MLGFPAFPDVPLAELFQAMDKFQSHLATMDTSHLSGDKLEGFEEIRSLFAEKAAFLKAELPGEFNRIRGEYNGLLGEVAAEKDKLDQEIARARQLAEDLPAMRDKAHADRRTFPPGRRPPPESCPEGKKKTFCLSSFEPILIALATTF